MAAQSSNRSRTHAWTARSRTVAAALLIAVGSALPAAAQEPDATAPLSPCVGEPGGCQARRPELVDFSAVLSISVSSPVASEEEAVAPARSGDVPFQLMMGALITAAGSDIAVSMYRIGQGRAREVGFGAWWQDSPVAFALSKSAMAALLAWQIQRIHRTRPKTAFVLGLVTAAVETGLVVRAARMTQPPR
jgi:hypothetical protein